MSYEDGGDFNIDQYYSQYENLNKYKCSYCKSALESDDDCQCGDITTTEEVIQLFNDSIFSTNRFVSVYSKSLLDVVLSFYINYKHLLLHNKNYKGVLSFNVATCNIYGRLCCFQKLLALRGNFYKLMYSGLQFYLWRKKNINIGNTRINYNYPFKLNFKKSQSELDKYESLLMTVEVVDEFLLMSVADTPNISNSFSEKLVTILPGHHTQHYVDANKKYLFYYNKIYDKDDKIKTLEENKENIRDHLVSIFKEFLACETVYVKYLAPNYYQVSRDGTFGQNLMSMEDINFIHNNLINNITENYLINNDYFINSAYINYIYELEQLKYLNINLEYIQQILLSFTKINQLTINNSKKTILITQLKHQLELCINKELVKHNLVSGIQVTICNAVSRTPHPSYYIYINLYGNITWENGMPVYTKENLMNIKIMKNVMKDLDLVVTRHTNITILNDYINQIKDYLGITDNDCGC